MERPSGMSRDVTVILGGEVAAAAALEAAAGDAPIPCASRAAATARLTAASIPSSILAPVDGRRVTCAED